MLNGAEIRKYPRTPHVEGSRPQPGDEDLDVVPADTLSGKYLVVEEKLDGANVGVSVGPGGRLRLQSRGHFLAGGPRERQFELLKSWAACHQDAITAVLGERYVLYGEWLYARHAVFYDALPHYFHEFDVLDRADDSFLSTERRRALLAELAIVSVPVLYQGTFPGLPVLRRMIVRSAYKSEHWRDRLAEVADSLGIDPSVASRETDPASEMEGLYLKVEQDGRVVERYKLVRATFQAAILDSGSHWQSRPIFPNQLRDGVDLYAPSVVEVSAS